MGDGDDSGGDDEDEVSGVPCIAIPSKAFHCTQLTRYEMDGLSSHPKLKSPTHHFPKLFAASQGNFSGGGRRRSGLRNSSTNSDCYGYTVVPFTAFLQRGEKASLLERTEPRE